MRVKFITMALLAVFLLVVMHWGIPKLMHPMPTVTPIQAQAQAQAIHLESAQFSTLPGWGKADLLTSFKTFQASCRVFLKQDPEQNVGSDVIPMKAKDWQPVCHQAMKLNIHTQHEAKIFFQKSFEPKAFYDAKPVEGLFTGYYQPTVQGSLVKTKRFSVPLYGVPRDLVRVQLRDFNPELPNRVLVGRLLGGKLIPYYTRKAIGHGAIDQKASVVAWVDHVVERLFLEIEGSGVVALPNGKTLFIGYAAQNGAPYTAIARVLIDRGIMTRDEASMQRIRGYLAKHPDQVEDVLNQNESFVFFKRIEQQGAMGAQGIVLTDGYSLAVDKDWVPLGTPIWLDTRRPDVKTNQTHVFRRLMVAQDTGGAIRGPVRGDVFWGSRESAAAIAGKMKDPGRYWLLLPKVAR